MNVESQDLRAQLLKTDAEFSQLATKHYLSEPEQVEEVTLKKRKLQVKDRMEDILRRHRQQV